MHWYTHIGYTDSGSGENSSNNSSANNTPTTPSTFLHQQHQQSTTLSSSSSSSNNAENSGRRRTLQLEQQRTRLGAQSPLPPHLQTNVRRKKRKALSKKTNAKSPLQQPNANHNNNDADDGSSASAALIENNKNEDDETMNHSDDPTTTTVNTSSALSPTHEQHGEDDDDAEYEDDDEEEEGDSLIDEYDYRTSHLTPTTTSLRNVIQSDIISEVDHSVDNVSGTTINSNNNSINDHQSPDGTMISKLRLPHVHHHMIRASDLDKQRTDSYDEEDDEDGYEEEDEEDDEEDGEEFDDDDYEEDRRLFRRRNGTTNELDDEEEDEEESCLTEQSNCPFEFSAKTRLQTPFLLGVIVSCWDNTLGPKPIQVWHAKKHVSALDQELILFITRFTLIDELSREDQIASSPGGVELKFNVLNDMNIIVLTSVFIGRLYNQMLRSYANTVYTINIVMSRTQLSKYLSMHEIIKQRVVTLTRIIQSSLQQESNWQKPPLVGSSSSPSLSHQHSLPKKSASSSGSLLMTIGRIMPLQRGSSLASTTSDNTMTNMSIGSTFTNSYHMSNHYYIENPGPQFILSQFEIRLIEFVGMFDTLFRGGLRPFTAHETVFGRNFINHVSNSASLEFLQKAITSHLETHGYSVVIGPESQIEEVNMWVNTLSCFLLPREAKLCRSASIGNKFTPELHVQGIVYNSTHPYATSTTSSTAPTSVTSEAVLKFLVPSSSVLSGKFPVSVIDVHNKLVYSFTQYAFFSILKRDYFTNQTPSIHSPLRNNLAVLGNEKAGPDSAHSDKIKSSFTRHNRACYSVNLLIKDLSICGYVDAELRLGYIQEWVRILNRRALTVCKFIGVVEPKLVDCTRLASLQSDEFQLSNTQRSNGWNMKELKRRILAFLVNDLKTARGGSMTEDMKKSELHVLMATAEKLYPGVYMLVMGNPEKGVETVVSFFEGY